MLAVDSAKMFRIRSKMWNMGIQFGNISFAIPCVVPHSLVQMQLRLYMSESERAIERIGAGALMSANRAEQTESFRRENRVSPAMTTKTNMF